MVVLRCCLLGVDLSPVHVVEFKMSAFDGVLPAALSWPLRLSWRGHCARWAAAGCTEPQGTSHSFMWAMESARSHRGKGWSGGS